MKRNSLIIVLIVAILATSACTSTGSSTAESPVTLPVVATQTLDRHPEPLPAPSPVAIVAPATPAPPPCLNGQDANGWPLIGRSGQLYEGIGNSCWLCSSGNWVAQDWSACEVASATPLPERVPEPPLSYEAMGEEGMNTLFFAMWLDAVYSRGQQLVEDGIDPGSDEGEEQIRLAGEEALRTPYSFSEGSFSYGDLLRSGALTVLPIRDISGGLNCASAWAALFDMYVHYTSGMSLFIPEAHSTSHPRATIGGREYSTWELIEHLMGCGAERFRIEWGARDDRGQEGTRVTRLYFQPEVVETAAVVLVVVGTVYVVVCLATGQIEGLVLAPVFF